MSKEITIAGYTPDVTKVRVIDKTHIYTGKEGVVARVGTAGEVNLIHVQLFGIQTIITFVERQLECFSYG